jgi:hypothetical protein
VRISLTEGTSGCLSSLGGARGDWLGAGRLTDG